MVTAGRGRAFTVGACSSVCVFAVLVMIWVVMGEVFVVAEVVVLAAAAAVVVCCPLFHVTLTSQPTTAMKP
jgi:hypothetical protein